MEKLGKKNLSISIVLLISIYLFQLLQAFLFHEMDYISNYVLRALGGFLSLIAIPLIVAIIVKLAFKKLFLGAFWKSLLFIAIPLSLVSAYGAYHESTQRKAYPSQSKITPRKYEPTPSELQNFTTKVGSQSFLKMNQINDAIKNSPTNAINYYNRGILYSSERNHSKAIQDYSRAIELDPNLSVAYLNRSAEYLFLNELEKALSDCSKAIQLNPNLSEAFFNRAKIKIHLGKESESLEDMKQAARLGNSEAISILRKNNIDWNDNGAKNIDNNNDRIKLLSKWSYLDKTTAEIDKEYHYYMLQDEKSPVLGRTANEIKGLLGTPDFEGHAVYKRDLQCENFKIKVKGYLMIYCGSIKNKTPNIILVFAELYPYGTVQNTDEPLFVRYIIEDAKSNNEQARIKCIQR